MAFVTAVRPSVLWRVPLGFIAVVLVIYLAIIAGVAKSGSGGAILAAVILFVVVAAAMLLGTWFSIRRLRGSAFVVDGDGMEIRTPRGSRRLTWTDVDHTTVAPAKGGGHLVLAELRDGVEAPARTPVGYPQWSKERGCVVVIRIESFTATPAEVTEALRRHAGSTWKDA
jgi:hypothetical protein